MVKKRRSPLNEGKDVILPENCALSNKNNGVGDERSKGKGLAPSAVSEKKSKADCGKGNGEEKEPQMPTRCSTRVTKRPKRDTSPPPSPPKKSLKETKTATPEQAKTRRNWELWTIEDKDTFFEGLCEHGKDFDAIVALITLKAKKKNKPELIKTKDQIRHFYYRTWHKIAKFIEKKEGIGKHALELYGLINYGEFRKRNGPKLDEKTGQKLNELVHKGVTSFKIKGKNHRFRTPVCRALKKLNHVEEQKEEGRLKIPDKIMIELNPHTNESWTYVQSMAQNPRLRVSLKGEKRLSSVIEYLSKKWKPHQYRLKEDMGVKENLSKELILMAAPDSKLEAYELTPVPVQPRMDLALENYKENMKNLPDSSNSPPNKKGKGSHKPNMNTAITVVARQNSLPGLEDSCPAQEGLQIFSLQRQSTLSNTSTAELEQNGNSKKNDTKGELTNVDMPVFGNGATSINLNLAESSAFVNSDSKDSAGAGSSTSEPLTDMQSKIDKLKKGLTSNEATGITIAELYLLMGCPEKIRLDYEWSSKTSEIMQMKLSLASMLKRLVNIATTEFHDVAKVKQNMSRIASPTRCSCGGSLMNGTPPHAKGVSRSPRVSQGSVGKSPSTPKYGAKGGGAGGRQNAAAPKAARDAATSQDNGSLMASATPHMGGPAGDSAVFRVPNSAPLKSQPLVPKISPSSQANKDLLQQITNISKHNSIYIPRRPKRMARQVRRPLVVQRTLLPKTQVPSHQIMTLAMLHNSSQLAQTASFMPVLPNQTIPNQTIPPTGQPVAKQFVPATNIMNVAASMSGISTATSNGLEVKDEVKAETSSASGVNIPSTQGQSANGTMANSPTSRITTTQTNMQSSMDDEVANHCPSVRGSNSGDTNGSTAILNDSISSLLDISLPGPPDDAPADGNDKLIDIALGNTSTGFTGLIGTSKSTETDSCRTPNSSPTKGFKLNNIGPENQWLGGEDFSLSNLLSESPLKKTSANPTLGSANPNMPNAVVINESSRDSLSRDSLSKGFDVDQTLQCMMNENSMDYASKFLDLVAQVSASTECKKGDTSHV